jgi:hypothetical protein
VYVCVYIHVEVTGQPLVSFSGTFYDVVCLFVCLFVCQDRVSLYSPGCPGTYLFIYLFIYLLRRGLSGQQVAKICLVSAL